MPDDTRAQASALRVGDLPLGVLCRTGFVLSFAFWVPLGVILGVVDMIGGGAVTWLGRDASGVLAVPAGAAGGFVLALENDVALALGALLVVGVGRLRRQR